MSRTRNTHETMRIRSFPLLHDPIWLLGHDVVDLLVEYLNAPATAVRA